MTKSEKSALIAEPCAWKTGDRRCGIPVSSGVRCQWHQYWLRLVETGAIGDGQEDTFRAWWAQFQPTGIYADNPGPWWADVDVLWSCLSGCTEAPTLTPALARELYSRRVEVRRFLQGLPMGQTPWDRVHGLPLPPWELAEWQAILTRITNHGSFQHHDIYG